MKSFQSIFQLMKTQLVELYTLTNQVIRGLTNGPQENKAEALIYSIIIEYKGIMISEIADDMAQRIDTELRERGLYK